MEPKRRGRPPGTGNRTHEERVAAAIRRDTHRLVVDKMVGKGLEAVDAVLENRIPNRPGKPIRTIAQCKDDAMEMLSQQIWNLQGIAEKDGLSESEEARLLKLIAGLNAALPKPVEKKRLEDMTDEELERV